MKIYISDSKRMDILPDLSPSQYQFPTWQFPPKVFSDVNPQKANGPDSSAPDGVPARIFKVAAKEIAPVWLKILKILRDKWGISRPDGVQIFSPCS